MFGILLNILDLFLQFAGNYRSVLHFAGNYGSFLHFAGNCRYLFAFCRKLLIVFAFCWKLRISFALCWILQIFLHFAGNYDFFAICWKLRISFLHLAGNHGSFLHFAGNYGSLLHFLHFAGVGGSVKWMAEDLSSVYRCHPSMEGSTKTLGNAMWSFTARKILIW